MATGDYMDFNFEQEGTHWETERKGSEAANMGFTWSNPNKQEVREKTIQEQSIPTSSIEFDSDWRNASIQLDNIFPELAYTNRTNQEMFADKINQVQHCHICGSTYLEGGQNCHNLNKHGNNRLQESNLQDLSNRDSNPNPNSDMKKFSDAKLQVEAFSNKNIQDISQFSVKGHDVEGFRKPIFQSLWYPDTSLLSATWPEVQPFAHNLSIQSQQCPQPSGRGLDMEALSCASATWTKVGTFSSNGIPYQRCPDISSTGGDMEALFNKTNQAQLCQDIPRLSGAVPVMETDSNTTIPFQPYPHITHSSDEAPDVQPIFKSRFQAQSCVSLGSTNLDPKQQCLDCEGNPSIHAKGNNEPAVEASKPKQSRIRWSLKETTDLVKYRVEMDEIFKCGKWSQQHLWDRIACKLNSIYTFRLNGLTGKVCLQKWSKLLQEVKRMKKEGQTIEGYFKDVESLDGNPSHNPNDLAWNSEDTLNLVLCRKEMDAKFKVFKDNHAGLWEEVSRRLKFYHKCDKTPRACSEKWDDILEEYSASKRKGEQIQGYLRTVETIMEKDRSVLINFGTASSRVFIFETATSESIKQAIKWTFGLETPFWLEDEKGIVQPVHSGMPLNKVYSIFLSRRPWN